MGFLILFAMRLLPIGLIVLVKQGSVQYGLVLIAALITAAMVLMGLYIDFLRGHFYANEYNNAIADPLRERIGRLAPLRLGVFAAYLVMLVLLAIA